LNRTRCLVSLKYLNGYFNIILILILKIFLYEVFKVQWCTLLALPIRIPLRFMLMSRCRAIQSRFYMSDCEQALISQ